MEKEYKFALTRSAYLKLLTETSPQREKAQVNTYFDDKKRSLRRNRAGLRLRIEGKQAWLTLKIDPAGKPAASRQGFHQRHEWESRMPFPTAQKLARLGRISKVRSPVLRTFQKQLPEIALETLRPMGSLKTWRRPLKCGRFLAELDRWQVGKHEFYELELETSQPKPALVALRKLFREYGIALRPRRTTKLATLFRLQSR